MINQNQKMSKHGFRYRGTEASRLENLTDAVFGFAITLLVIASEVPRSYVELQASMYDFVGFLFCAFLLLGIWNNHKNFFLHYGLRDSFTQVSNFIFLFVLLFYIYPLKYLFSYVGSSLFIYFLSNSGFHSEAMNMAIEKVSLARLETDQWEDLMIRFGAGLFLIYTIFALMHINALKKKKALALNALEIHETKTFIYHFLALILIALSSMLIVMVGGGRYSASAGFVYMLIPILLTLIKKYRDKRLPPFETSDQ